jgi:hypothetical protein
MAQINRHQSDTALVDSGFVEERQSTRTGEGLNSALRAIGAVAGGIATIIGIVALIRIRWTDGFSSAPVDVLGMAFTPAIAVATTVGGLIALAAGAAADRTSKLVVGIVLACIGGAILLAGTSRANWKLSTGHGWLALLVGTVLIVTGLAMRHFVETRRSVRTDAQQV